LKKYLSRVCLISFFGVAIIDHAREVGTWEGPNPRKIEIQISKMESECAKSEKAPFKLII